MTVDPSIDELYDKRESIRSAALSLLTGTTWPPGSTKAADALRQTINGIPEFPPHSSVITFKGALMEFMEVLEGTHRRMQDASEKYGKGKGGIFATVKNKLTSGHRRRCTDALWGCRAEIENASAELRSCLSKISTSGDTAIGPVQDSETPSELQPQSSAPLVGDDHTPEPFNPSRTPQTSPVKQTLVSEPSTTQPTSLQNSSPGPAEGGANGSSFRDRALTVARKTFETVEVVSGAIPGVGDFVGVAAKVGLAFVNMIETMDENEDVSKELTSHTSKLSSYLEHFKNKVDADEGDEVAAHIEGLHRELKCVQDKVKTWNSLGRLKKAFLAKDHAQELNARQDTVQTALEEMQLLVSLKTTDLVVELKDNVSRTERTRLLDRLGDGTYGARGNTIEEVICLPGTRVEILSRINDWIRDAPTPANRVLWIRGMAGRGKSTIASTVAHNWGSKGSCAIFQFRRGQHELDGHFVCSLARQLGKCLVPEVKNAILDCVRKNEDIAKERLEQQFKALFVGALGTIQNHAHPVVIVVDALDECKNVNDVVQLVRLIGQHSTSLPANVKFLLTCRPEPPLVLALELGKWRAEDLDTMSHISEDITVFLQHACTRIRKDHGFPETWPSSNDLEGMVEMSQGLFQWARTVVAFMGDGSPEHRLRGLLQHPSKWRGLDDLYRQILSRAFDKVDKDSEREQVLSWVLGTLVVAPHPVTLEVIAFLHADHEIFEGQQGIFQFLRDDILADLNSLLHIPTSPSEPVRFMHTSIRDLLTAQARCEDQRYFVDSVQDHRRLANISLQIMDRDLKQNICRSPGAPKANPEFQDSHVTSGLQYCCRSWSTHLLAGNLPSEAARHAVSLIPDNFKRFSAQKILCWLEVMSTIGAMSEAYIIATHVHQWLAKYPGDVSDDALRTLWNDTQRFITVFFKSISSNALDIYASALPQCPVETKLWLTYRGQAMAWFLGGKRERNWSAHIWTSSTALPVRSVAFSPNGGTVASVSSGFWEKPVVQLWDALTGAPLGDPITDHRDSINSIVFSPDGKFLASESGGKVVRLWNAQTGAPLSDFQTGHNNSITSVVFSLDGKILASGSDDKTVRLWDVRTRAPLGNPLTGHSSSITSVAFSPDKKVLASGSWDETVRLWDVQTGAPLGDPLTGHSSFIRSIVFSPDSKVLASGSEDATVRLWDVQTIAPLGDPLTGHRFGIASVAFLREGKVLASVSYDNTVRFWDAETGALLGKPLTSDSTAIMPIVLSSDGKVLASGTWDKTVRLWDAQTGAPLGDPLTGHSSLISSIGFSPDSKVLASGSDDKTVRLWDVQTGAPLGDRQTCTLAAHAPDGKVLASGLDGVVVQLEAAETRARASDLPGYSDSVYSIVFSPDGKILASGLADTTVRLWDSRTGALLGSPLTGHTDAVTSVVFSLDGKILLSGSWDKTVRLWDAQTGAPLGDPLTGHSRSITSVAFSPNGKALASGSYDGTVRLWDVPTGAPLGELVTDHSNSINSIAFSPDGKILASGSDSTRIQLWDAQTGAPLGDPQTSHRHSNHSDSITSVVFSPDSKVLASGSDDETVRLWDVQTGAPLGNPLTGHSKSVASVVFSPDGKVLASGSYDGTVRFWDVSAGALLGDPLNHHGGSITSIAFSPNGNVLASASSNGMVQFGDPVTHRRFLAYRPFNLLTF